MVGAVQCRGRLVKIALGAALGDDGLIGEIDMHLVVALPIHAKDFDILDRLAELKLADDHCTSRRPAVRAGPPVRHGDSQAFHF